MNFEQIADTAEPDPGLDKANEVTVAWTPVLGAPWYERMATDDNSVDIFHDDEHQLLICGGAWI